MSTSASSVSLEALLNAYALLEIDLTAGAAAIGRAHRQMVGRGSVASASIIVAFAVGLFLLRRTRRPVPWEPMEEVLAGVLRLFLRQM
jgi:hypothetical protein